MSHWLLDAMEEKRALSLREADKVQFYREMAREAPDFDVENLLEVIAALEIAVLDLQLDRLDDDIERRALLHKAAAEDRKSVV